VTEPAASSLRQVSALFLPPEQQISVVWFFLFLSLSPSPFFLFFFRLFCLRSPVTTCSPPTSRSPNQPVSPPLPELNIFLHPSGLSYSHFPLYHIRLRSVFPLLPSARAAPAVEMRSRPRLGCSFPERGACDSRKR